MSTAHHSPDKDYMRIFEHYDASSIVFGDAAFTQLSEELLLNGKTVLLLIKGENSAMENGAYQAFINMALGIDGIETPLFNGVPSEPDVECVREIVLKMKETNPDAVAALGGGSVMDAAKAAYLSWQTGLDVTELFGVNKASGKFPDRTFQRVICMPTTAGTGSEVTPYANIVDKEKKLKYLISEQQIVPEVALVDPSFTKSMNMELTAATALDALTHAAESLLNTKSGHPEAEEWALESIKLIRYALPRILSKAEPDPLDREMLSAAATLAGMCIRLRPTALPHLCSYSMWGKIHHGLAVALLLPHFWRYYLTESAVAEQTMKLAGIFPSEQPQNTPEDVIAAFEEFLKNVSPIKTLKDAKVLDPEMIAKIASDAAKTPAKLQSAPRSITADTAEQELTAILTRAVQ